MMLDQRQGSCLRLCPAMRGPVWLLDDEKPDELLWDDHWPGLSLWVEHTE